MNNYEIKSKTYAIGERVASKKKFKTFIGSGIANRSIVHRKSQDALKIIKDKAKSYDTLGLCTCQVINGKKCFNPEQCLNRLSYVECGEECDQGTGSCQNRGCSTQTSKLLKLVGQGNCGHGPVASEDIMAGEFIAEYTGIINIRNLNPDVNDTVYAATLIEHGDRDNDVIIDALRKGNITRYIQNSHYPNAEMQHIKVGKEIRICFYAIDFIPEGSFITFHYGEDVCRMIKECHCLEIEHCPHGFKILRTLEEKRRRSGTSKNQNQRESNLSLNPDTWQVRNVPDEETDATQCTLTFDTTSEIDLMESEFTRLNIFPPPRAVPEHFSSPIPSALADLGFESDQSNDHPEQNDNDNHLDQNQSPLHSSQSSNGPPSPKPGTSTQNEDDDAAHHEVNVQHIDRNELVEHYMRRLEEKIERSKGQTRGIGFGRPPRGLPNWKCELCDPTLSDITFKQKCDYRIHLERVHAKLGKFQCNLDGCTRSFHIGKDLKEHQESHKPKQDRVRYMCRDCRQTYSKPTAVARHARSDGSKCKVRRYKKIDENGIHVKYGGEADETDPSSNDEEEKEKV